MEYLNLTDPITLLLLLGVLVAVLGLLLAGYGIINWFLRGGKVTSRIDQYVEPGLAPAEIQARPIITREIQGSLFNRIIKDAAGKWVTYLARFTPQKMADEMERQLTVADHPGNLHADSFFALRLLLLITAIFLAFLLNRNLEALNFSTMLLGMLLILIFWLLPSAWLRGKMRARQDEIKRNLPDALDMLSVCASAGLGFDQSLQRISQYWHTELGKELTRVIHEMEMGVPRAEALRNMSKRLDVDDLSRFIATIVQAERIGMSYADVLHGQAVQMRVLRQLRAREVANRLPGQMIIPVALFIFPALIIVILGPAIPLLLSIF